MEYDDSPEARSAASLAEKLLPPGLAAAWRAYTGKEAVREKIRETCAEIMGQVEMIAGVECAERLSVSVLAEAEHG